MEIRARLVSIFVGTTALIMAGALVSIFVEKLKLQLVAPVAGVAAALSVLIFASRFNSAKKDQFISTPIESSSSPAARRTPGITFLRIVMIATLCVGALMIVTFVVEGWMGTLYPEDVRRFVPKAAFAVALAIYIFHKTRNKSES